MPLPLALAQRLQKRGILPKDGQYFKSRDTGKQSLYFKAKQ